MLETGDCPRMRESDTAAELGVPRSGAIVLKGKSSLYPRCTAWGVRQHMGRFQAINGKEMRQFYETCLLVSGPSDNNPRSIPGILEQTRTGQNVRREDREAELNAGPNSGKKPGSGAGIKADTMA